MPYSKSSSKKVVFGKILQQTVLIIHYKTVIKMALKYNAMALYIQSAGEVTTETKVRFCVTVGG